jgi:DNA-directed RNA polymerase subunit RPC12/RpoP
VRCIYCKQNRRAVEIEREVIDARFYGDVPGSSDAPCCTPESTYQCPLCGSEDLDFGMHYATTSWEDGDETREEYRCLKCGSTGAVEEAAPPAQPWNELEAVADAAAKQRGFEHWADYLDTVRGAPACEDRPPLLEVA